MIGMKLSKLWVRLTIQLSSRWVFTKWKTTGCFRRAELTGRNIEDQTSTTKKEMMQYLLKMIWCKQHNSLAMKFITHHLKEWSLLLNLLWVKEWISIYGIQRRFTSTTIATNHNALVAYHAPEYRGELSSMLERKVLYRLDVLSDDQKTYFEATQARFQHLDHQIEGIQKQLAELYYKK